MSQCNIQGAAKYLEELQAKLKAVDNTSASELIGSIYTPVADNMLAIRHASSFAGLGNINIHKPYEEYLLESPRPKKSKKQKVPKQQAPVTPPKTEAIAGLELDKVHTLPIGNFMDVIDQIAAHVDSNRNLNTPSPEVQENLKVFSDVIRRYIAGSSRQVKIKLVPHIDRGKVERQPLGTYNRKSGTITIAVSPDGTKVSPYALHVPTAKVILHELVHQLTVDTLAKSPELTAKVTKLMDYAKQAYIKKYGKEPEYAAGTATYGLTHPAEFVAEAYTSIEMQEMLADIAPTKHKTILQRTKDIFKELIGIAKKGDPETYTLLEEALELVDEVMADAPPWIEGDAQITEGIIPPSSNNPTLEAQEGPVNAEVTYDMYSTNLLASNPDKVFVFGDNDKRSGKGGQAAVRNEPNALGIRTKKAPSNLPRAFYTDKELDENKAKIDEDIATIKAAGKDVVFPAGGLGTGLARLGEKAPKTAQYLHDRIQQEFGVSVRTGVTTEGHTTPAIIEDADTPSSTGSYKITGDMKTNEGQTEAINTIMEWFKGAKRGESFLLQGRGGTGKTTVINVLLRELGINPSQVAFATPTNKAKKVIRKANENTQYGGSSYYTIAQILSLKPRFDNDGNQIFETDQYAEEVELPKVLVVDEASMLHSSNYDELMYKAAQFGTKVIFMGDNAQLPPIGDPRAPIKSVVFDDNLNTSYALNQLMRQAEGSPIISFTSRLIDIVNQIEDVLSHGATPQSVKQRLNLTTFDGNVYSKVDADGNGVVMTNEQFNDILPSFLDDYKKNPEGTKYIGFNNHKHANTIQKTNMIRSSLYGDQASQEKFIKGEPLMLNGPYISNLAADELEIFDNGEEFTVISSKKRKLRLPYKVGKKVITTKESIEIYEIEAKDNASGKTVQLRTPVGTAQEVRAFIEKEKENTIANGANPAGAYTLISTLGGDLSHGYIINSHRSQGSTYNTVYMDLGNIMGQYNSSANDIIKSLYVAASRPRTRLVVMDSRSRGGAVLNPGKVQQPDDRPFAFGDVDIAEANDIIRKVDKCKGDS